MNRSATAIDGRHIVICNWRDSRHPQAGGSELYCEEVARQLHRLGADVTLLTSRSPGTPATEEVHFGTVVRRGSTYGTYPAGLLWLLLHRRDIDGVIDSENGIPYFSPLAVTARTPVILLIHHVHQQQFELYFPPIAAAVGKWLEKYLARWVYGRRAMCVVSPSTRAEVRRQLAFKGPVYVAPNGVTISPTHGEVARSVEPRIVCVGRLVPHKRFELLIDAVPQLLERWPSLTVHLVGDGEARDALERAVQVRNLGGTVTLHGRLSQNDRDTLTRSAWLTVNPSAGEGWGLSVIEAAAHGVPAVAFQVPGLQDAVCDESTGWLIDEPAQLAAAIEQALETVTDPTEADCWAARCREWSASFNWESTARRILSVLESEDDRLKHGLDERRRRSDATTVVELPRHLLTRQALLRLRRMDQVRVNGETVQLLLGGADERDAERVLDRLGLPIQFARTARVARHYDLLGWTFPERLLDSLYADEVDLTEELVVSLVEEDAPSGQVIRLASHGPGNDRWRRPALP
jgi:glycosyltransferase involved in cell wall biosynthesis